MNKDDRKVVYLAIVSGLASGAVGAIITSAIQNQSLGEQTVELQNEVSALQIQNKILNDTQNVHKDQTMIMNQTLYDLKKSIEKKSLISVKVLPHLDESETPFDIGTNMEFGPEFKREIHQIKRSIPLKDNQTIIFDVIITNVGSDTAVLNMLQVQVVTIHSEKSTAWRAFSNNINEILKVNDQPKIIQYELKIDSKYSPKGELYFTVVHDNGVDESYSLPYYYKDHD